MDKKILTAQIEFTMQDATGPNPGGLAFELFDDSGDRIAYISSVDEAADMIRDLIDPDKLSNIEVF